ncbi:MAG: diphosphomevalonate decarboxylase [Candidatus Microgenomates bacterium]
MKKTIVLSPANIAFVKYWGRRDDNLILPLNSSVSMNMSGCTTTTSCEWGEWEEDSIKIKFKGKELVEASGVAREKALRVVERVREKLGTKLRVCIESENNFPEATGIASSASGFSALTKALYESFGTSLSEKEMTIETRLSGSGSACRSIPDGFVVWDKGSKDDGSDSFAYSIAQANHWELVDLVCVVDIGNKKISSGEGHVRAKNEYMQARLKNIDNRVRETIAAIKEKDLEKLGVVTEIEAMSLHTVCMMSEPPIFYLNGATFEVMSIIRELREKGIIAYYTMDAGANVHVITEMKYLPRVRCALSEIDKVVMMIENVATYGARVL